MHKREWQHIVTGDTLQALISLADVPSCFLVRGIRKLSKVERLLLSLLFVEQLDLGTIASVLDEDVAGVKSIYKTSLNHLRAGVQTTEKQTAGTRHLPEDRLGESMRSAEIDNPSSRMAHQMTESYRLLVKAGLYSVSIKEVACNLKRAAISVQTYSGLPLANDQKSPGPSY